MWLFRAWRREREREREGEGGEREGGKERGRGGKRGGREGGERPVNTHTGCGDITMITMGMEFQECN